jgi:hypothetical protein
MAFSYNFDIGCEFGGGFMNDWFRDLRSRVLGYGAGVLVKF